jgi:hypothetical protein
VFVDNCKLVEEPSNEDRVLEFVHNEHARAYPIKILNWHGILNDDVGGKPVIISYCPLCGTDMVFDAHVKNRNLEFRDCSIKMICFFNVHQTKSLWFQIKSEAVAGRLKGTRLELLVSTHTNWESWKKKYPKRVGAI